MKIEDDKGNKIKLSKQDSLKLCEEGFNAYLQILKSAGVTLEDDVLQSRKKRWFDGWED